MRQNLWNSGSLWDISESTKGVGVEEINEDEIAGITISRVEIYNGKNT